MPLERDALVDEINAHEIGPKNEETTLAKGTFFSWYILTLFQQIRSFTATHYSGLFIFQPLC